MAQGMPDIRSTGRADFRDDGELMEVVHHGHDLPMRLVDEELPALRGRALEEPIPDMGGDGSADVNDDGNVDGQDLGAILGEWGPVQQ